MGRLFAHSRLSAMPLASAGSAMSERIGDGSFDASSLIEDPSFVAEARQVAAFPGEPRASVGFRHRIRGICPAPQDCLRK